MGNQASLPEHRLFCQPLKAYLNQVSQRQEQCKSDLNTRQASLSTYLDTTANTKQQRHDILHTIFLLQQLTLPELVAPILDYAELWASDSSEMYIDPRDGWLETPMFDAHLGTPILTFGPLSRCQARHLRSLTIRVACTEKVNPRRFSQMYSWFETHLASEASEYDIHLEKLSLLSHDTHAEFISVASASPYFVMFQQHQYPQTGSYSTTWRLDEETQSNMVAKLNVLEEGDCIQLTAHTSAPRNWQAVNLVRFAQIELRYHGYR